MLGSAIGKALTSRGLATLKLVRRQPSMDNELEWNPVEGGGIARIEMLEGVSAAIHLSGANVASRRWTSAFKREMTASRVGSTRVLAEALARLKRPPKVLIAASATGIYGNRGDALLDENSPAGSGFFPELCTAWELAAKPASDAGIRVVHLRLGVVIGAAGGLMGRMVPLFRLGLGGPLGDGRQWMSWISERDVVSAALMALDDGKIQGVVNTVAPEPVTNADFTRELARAVHRAAPIPAPAFALRLAFGEMADEALLASTRVIPKRLIEAGFRFEYPTLPEAFRGALEGR